MLKQFYHDLHYKTWSICVSLVFNILGLHLILNSPPMHLFDFPSMFLPSGECWLSKSLSLSFPLLTSQSLSLPLILPLSLTTQIIDLPQPLDSCEYYNLNPQLSLFSSLHSQTGTISLALLRLVMAKWKPEAHKTLNMLGF